MNRYEQIKTMTIDELVNLLNRFKFESETTRDFSIIIDYDKCYSCPNSCPDDVFGFCCLAGFSCSNARTFEDCIRAWLMKEEL